MNKNEKSLRIWTREELIITYYVTRYDLTGLGITEEDLVLGVIGGTTVHSFHMQQANFRYGLGIEGYQLDSVSRSMWNLIEEFKDKEMLDIRPMIIDYISKSNEKIKKSQIQQRNKKTETKMSEANRLLDEQFQRELKKKMFGRRLKKVVKS